ncbi:unnamed protein product, partial [Symbiodinium pilosum]
QVRRHLLHAIPVCSFSMRDGVADVDLHANTVTWTTIMGIVLQSDHASKRGTVTSLTCCSFCKASGTSR